MSHGRIAKSKFMIYCNTNLNRTLKMLSSNRQIASKRSRLIVAQLSFYKDKTNILSNIKKIEKQNISIFEDIFGETAAICNKKRL